MAFRIQNVARASESHGAFGLLALLLVVILLYVRSLKGGFILDDFLFLTNENVTDASRWSHFLTLEGSRSLAYLTFHLNYRWSGGDPQTYHIVNLFLHLLNTVLVYLGLYKIMSRSGPLVGPDVGTSDRPPVHFAVLAGTVFFALHPLQTETVNYIYQRSSLLAALFGLGGLVVLSWKPRSVPTLVSATLLYCLAVLSKETAIVWVPAYLVVLSLLPPGDGDPWRLTGRRASLMILLGTLGGVWAFWKLSSSGEETLGLGSVHTVAEYLMTECRVIVKYLILVVIPVGQNVDHEIQSASQLSWALIWPAVILVLILIATMTAARRGKITGIGGVLCFLFLLPTSSVVPSDDLMFEHRMYLPLFGLSLVVAGTAAWILDRRQGKPAWRWMLPVVLALFLIPWTWSRNGLWSDPVELWKDSVSQSPQKARPRLVLATLLLNGGDTRKAIPYLREALVLDPGNREALNNLGVAYRRLGDLKQAETFWKRAIQADPQYATAHRNLAGHYYAARRFAEAARQYQQVLTLKPFDWKAYFDLGNVRWRLNDLTEAERLYRGALEKNPASATAFNNLAAVLQLRGKTEEAIQGFKTAIGLNPHYLEARINLVRVLVKDSRKEEARKELSELQKYHLNEIIRAKAQALAEQMKTR